MRTAPATSINCCEHNAHDGRVIPLRFRSRQQKKSRTGLKLRCFLRLRNRYQFCVDTNSVSMPSSVTGDTILEQCESIDYNATNSAETD